MPRLQSHIFFVFASRMYSIFLTILGLALSVHAQYDVPGDCQNFVTGVKAGFDIAQYSGRWFDQERYPLGDNSKCITSTYSEPTPGTMQLRTANIDINTGALSYMTLSGPFDTPGSGEAKFTLDGTALTLPYWVLDTDYVSWALVWSCTQETPGQTKQRAWILTKTRVADPNALSTARSVAAANGLNEAWETVDQTTCPLGFF
ncbi:hypothetical protein B566_EDAN002437 [Ephemera danica]|nr:hypothetical protein B566_EDAN002437 [Ephemera danica]